MLELSHIMKHTFMQSYKWITLLCTMQKNFTTKGVPLVQTNSTLTLLFPERGVGREGRREKGREREREGREGTH